MFDGDLWSHDLRFITVTFIEFNLLPRFNQIIRIPETVEHMIPYKHLKNFEMAQT